MKYPLISWFFRLIGMGIGLTMAPVQAQQLTATVTRETPGLEEEFQVIFALSGGDAQITPPDFAGFQVVGTPQTRSQLKPVNGKVEKQITVAYTLKPLRAGNLTIGPARAQIGGASYATQPVTVRVQVQSLTPDVLKKLKNSIYIRHIADKTAIYIGEPVLITARLMVAEEESFGEYEAKTDPPPGFWMESPGELGRVPHTETVQGRTFKSYDQQLVVFPQAAGTFSLSPLSLSGQVLVKQEATGLGVLGEKVQAIERRQYTVPVTPVTLRVKPLPRPAPDNFSGLTGTVRLEATLDRTTTVTGEPVTLRLSYRGNAQFRQMAAPVLNLPADMEVYDPRIEEQFSLAGGVPMGTKTFEYLIVPRTPGTRQIPPVTVAYFDPASGTYKTLTSPAWSLAVTGEAIQSNAAADTAATLTLLPLVPTTTLRQAGGGWAGTWLMWGVWVLPILGAWLVIRWKKRDLAARADIVTWRAGKALQTARKQLSLLSGQLSSTPGAAFQQVPRIVWGYLSDKFNLTASAWSRAYAHELLRQHQVPDALTHMLLELLDQCNMAAYSPVVALSPEKTCETARDLIERLDQALTPAAT
ncbi:MAG: BatD family protein [Bacteroidia bacterium]|nr:BatD family protein [Bacteroidia bacterium]